jgi:transposase-like protein
MQDSSTAPTAVLQFRQDLQAKLRDGVRRAIETVLEEELLAALGADDHVRTPLRRGYRHGTTERTLTTREGTRAITVPRARLRAPDGHVQEFQSTVVPRYARRTREVDEALLGCYFGGVNSRRIRTALKPLFGEAHFSKSAVSRVVARVKDHFTTWQQRPLTDERYPVVFLDGVHLRVRLAGRVISVPVLAALGVTETGQKQLLALQLAAAEGTASWSGLLADLQRRGLPAPLLVVTDGHAGLKKALEAWPTVQVQRCTVHKGRNLEDACPVHARR